MTQTLYTFADFIDAKESDHMNDLFSTTNEINTMLGDIYTTPEFKQKLAATKDVREIVALLFQEVDEKLDIDSIKDLCYISFLIGKSVTTFMDVRKQLILHNKLSELDTLIKRADGRG